MNRRTHIALRTAALPGVALVAGVLAAGPAAAATPDGDVDVVNTETVQVYTSATGEVETKRIYEQLSLTGTGTVDLTNPVAIEGLRNLDGFDGLDVEDGNQVIKMDVDGKERLRSVSDYAGDLPLDVKVEYLLDGESVEPTDVVGKSGELEVKYTVKNVTGQEQEITVADGNGGTVTKTVDVPVPMVGTLTTVAPDSFTDVESATANMAGDGKGGTKLSFTMTLFPPIGSDTAEFGYKAQISEGVVPRASVSALPVNPLESATFKTAATSYQGGAATGGELAAGASEIDANLLKLRDGASDLLAGLIQLSDGADQLQAGLAGEAAPGADKLAAGADQLHDGLAGEAAPGAKKLAAGAAQLDAGTGDALAGSKKLTSGLGQISGGLGQLADNTSGLPAAKDGIAQLQGGVDLLLAGLGNPEDPKSLIGGLAGLEHGLSQLKSGSDQLVPGLQQLNSAQGLPAAKGGVDQVKAGLDASLAQGGSVDQLVGGLKMLKTKPVCASDNSCVGLVDQLIAGAEKSRTELTAASAGLGQVSGGLDSAITGLSRQIIPGAQQIQAGLGQARTGAGDLQAGAVQLKGGVQQVEGGLDKLAVGVTSAVQGVMQLNAGAGTAYAGSSDLTDGLGQINSGTGELSDGADELSDGLGDAADGSGQLSDGAGQLAAGLGDAADGSGRLADGLGEAEAGAPALPDGAERLSEEGTKKLVEAGKSTAMSYGEMYAVIEAGAERADAEKMVYGAPEDAIGLAAYSYEIEGEDGEQHRNVVRGLGALALLAAAGGTILLRRRMAA
jgi:putative membrane protein